MMVFAAAAAVSVIAGILTVTRRNPVYSAIWMLVCFLSFAVVYVKLQAPFLAAMHVLVYTGAILVLFLFVIMLLNLRPEEFGKEYPLPTRVFIALLCLGLFLFMVVPMVRDGSLNEPVDGPSYGSVQEVGQALFTKYALAFELVSALILVAIFGGVILAKRKL